MRYTLRQVFWEIKRSKWIMLACAVFLSLILFQLYAVYQCGWSNFLMYGERVGFAFLGGYCG